MFDKIYFRINNTKINNKLYINAEKTYYKNRSLETHGKFSLKCFII